MMLAIPIGVFFAVFCVSRSLADLHHALLSLIEGFALTISFKRWMNLVGRFRPSYAAIAASPGGDTEDGRQSYPSGHAAYMFLGMTITTMYLLGRTKVDDFNCKACDDRVGVLTLATSVPNPFRFL